MPGDRRAVLAASGTALFLVLLQLVTKATRDALFLSHFPASYLPAMMIAAALASWAVAMGASFVLARIGPLRLLTFLAVFNFTAFVAEWALASRFASAVAVALYLHLASLGALTLSTFWSQVNERFDPHRARQVVGRVNGGATLGGVLGGLLAVFIGPHVELADLLLVSAAASALALIGAQLLGSGPPAARVELPLSSLLRETPYLGQVALLVALVAMGSAFADFTLKARAASAGIPLVSFFAGFYTLAALITLVVQTTITRRALASVGLTRALGALPGGYIAAATGAAMFGGLPAAAVFSGTDMILGNSIHRSAYELLYTPIAPAKKRRLKLLFDVGVARLGDVLGGAVLLLLSPALAPLAGVAVASLALIVTTRLKRGYVDALATSLRTRAISLSESDLELLDLTTRATFHSTVTMDRQALLREIEANHPPGSVDGPAELLRLERAGVDAISAAIADDTRALAPRIALVRSLGRIGDAPSARALVEVIGSARLDLAAAAVDVLGVLVMASPALAPPRSQVIAWVTSALDRAPPGNDALARDERRRILDQVFGLFRLTFDAELIATAKLALSSDDPGLRGTALELLENLVPGSARPLMSGSPPR